MRPGNIDRRLTAAEAQLKATGGPRKIVVEVYEDADDADLLFAVGSLRDEDEIINIGTAGPVSGRSGESDRHQFRPAIVQLRRPDP